MQTNAAETVKKLIKERYVNARAIFWAGSVARGEETDTSDLDLVIVYEKLPNAFREAFIYDGWPIDTFVNDLETLRFFFEESRTGSGISGLIHMVLYGKEITPTSTFSENIKKLARQFLENGPAVWSRETIDKERFLITDTLDDILAPNSHAERLASTIKLFEALSQFYFRAQGKWCASGKSIIRYLEEDSPEIAEEFSMSFEDVFQSGNTERLKNLTHKILKPYGGLLWDGYRAEAPLECRSAGKVVLAETSDGCKFYLEEAINPEIANLLFEEIKSYNESKIGEYSRYHFTIYVHSQDDKILAGCTGNITWKNCYIEQFWVHAENRNKGIGSLMMKTLENHAKNNHCQDITVETVEFQARRFYEKIGFSIESISDDVYFPGYTQYLMKKLL